MALRIPPQDLDRTDCEDQEDLSNEQLRALLQRAEKRMRVAAAAETSQDDMVHLQETPYAGHTQLLPKTLGLKVGALTTPYVSTNNGVAQADPRRLLNDSVRSLSSKPLRVEDRVQLKENLVKSSQSLLDAGLSAPFWSRPASMKAFHIVTLRHFEEIPKAFKPTWIDRLTLLAGKKELKKDLQLLKMRGVLDPKRHYKKDDVKSLAPEFSQIGTVVEGPTEYFSSRLSNRERKKTLVEEVLGDERSTGRFKNKYREIQAVKTSGKKAFYNKLKEKRRHGVYKR